MEARDTHVCRSAVAHTCSAPVGLLHLILILRRVEFGIVTRTLYQAVRLP
jgi:hypothetical protein